MNTYSVAPLVSIIIPTYNHAAFLREALQSVCRQSFSAWEILVINNFSSDDTIAIVESFDDPRIRLINYQNNGVIAASRNQGIALANGRYVAFLDSDDLWYPDKLKQCIPYLDNGADLVAHGLKLIGEVNGNLFCGPKQRATFDALLDKGACITPSATMIRKSVLNKVGNFTESPEYNTAEDYHLWIKLARENVHMEFFDEILGEYRVHTGNHSGSAVRHMHSILHVIDEFLPVDASAGFASRLRVRRCKAMIYYGAGRSLYKTRLYSEARPVFSSSIVLWPFHVRTYAAIGFNTFNWLVSQFDFFKRENKLL